MQFIYDNLTATLIAITATLLLLSIQSRATQNNVAKTSRNMMKERAQTFATWVEKDLERMGANMTIEEVQEERPPFDNPEKTQMEGGTSLTEQFTFYRDRVDGDTGGDDGEEEEDYDYEDEDEGDEDVNETRIATRYQVEKVQDDPKALYQLTRKTKEVGTGTWSGAEVEGMSSPTLGYLQIDLLDKNADPVPSPKSNLSQVHSVRVRFSVVSPFRNDETVAQATHLGSVLVLREAETAGENIEISVPENWLDCLGDGWEELTYPDGSSFDCGSQCAYYASGGHRGSTSCGGGGDDDDDWWPFW